MTEPEKLDLTSHNLPEDKKGELLRLFPEIRTEGGKIDFDKLKLVLGETIDAGRERYGMTWPGKADVFKTIQTPSMGTLLPAPDESINFDTTENLIIEGDNLEVLKLLQKSYLGKVKMIYIDPPYNTGNDFIYPDNYAESLQTYLEYTKQVDAEGKKFGTNTDTDGRFHSRWMNMMYSRLYMAHNLLRKDGVVFISIDDTELFNLKNICDQIFGEENFLGNAVRVAKKSNNKGDHWSPNFDYVLTYAKDSNEVEPFLGGINISAYNLIDDEGYRKGEKYQLVRLYMSSIQNRNPEQRYWIDCPDGTKVIPPGSTFPPDRPVLGDGIWRWTKQKFDAEKEKIVVKQVRSSNLVNDKGEPASWNVFTKTYLNDVIENASAKPNSLIEDFINQMGTIELGELSIPFSYPKPSSLISYLMEISRVRESDIVLDFFAGSGSTGHAVLEQNTKNGTNCKFVLVQLPEPLEENSEAFKSGFRSISDITKERVRRVIKKLNDEEAGQLPMNGSAKQDRGFRVFKLAKSNFRTWDSANPKDSKGLEKQLELHIEHIRESRSSEDILYEILLKSGFPLTTSVEKIDLAGKSVYSISDGGMFICLEKELTVEVIRAMADKHPQRVVCLDLGFAGNDQLKTNAVQIFKNKEIVFKTV